MIDEVGIKQCIHISGLEFAESDELTDMILDQLGRYNNDTFYSEIYTVDEMLFDRAIQKIKNTLYKQKKPFSVEKYKEVVRNSERLQEDKD